MPAVPIPVCSRRWSRWSRARLRCRPTRCPTRPSTRSPVARRPEAGTSVRRVGAGTAARFHEIGGEVPPRLYHAGERSIIMTIVRWDSVGDMAARHEQRSRMLEGFYGPPQEDLARGSWVPAVDVYSNSQHELVLKAELPDMKEEEFELTVEDNTLTLRGERKLDTEITEEQFHRIERSYGPFARTFALPPTVDAGKVSAEYKAGVLTVRVPRREEAKPKQIKVQVAA